MQEKFGFDQKKETQQIAKNEELLDPASMSEMGSISPGSSLEKTKKHLRNAGMALISMLSLSPALGQKKPETKKQVPPFETSDKKEYKQIIFQFNCQRCKWIYYKLLGRTKL